jgi:transposase, IS5 family
VTYITADPGHASADTPRGDDAKTQRKKEGIWTKKVKKFNFRFKLHTQEDFDFRLIWEIKTTTASVYDSQIDLSEQGEVVYWNWNYFGIETKGFDATMQRV